MCAHTAVSEGGKDFECSRTRMRQEYYYIQLLGSRDILGKSVKHT